MTKLLSNTKLGLLIVFILTVNAECMTKGNVKVGVFIMSIYNMDVVNNSFKVNFWIWTVADKNSHYDISELDIVNAENISVSHVDRETIDHFIWSTEEVNATIRFNWELKSFPFDKQNLKIILEDANADSSQIVYLPDTNAMLSQIPLKLEGKKKAQGEVNSENNNS